MCWAVLDLLHGIEPTATVPAWGNHFRNCWQQFSPIFLVRYQPVAWSAGQKHTFPRPSWGDSGISLRQDFLLAGGRSWKIKKSPFGRRLVWNGDKRSIWKMIASETGIQSPFGRRLLKKRVKEVHLEDDCSNNGEKSPFGRRLLQKRGQEVPCVEDWS